MLRAGHSREAVMKVSRNDFIKKHGTGIGINLVFRDYYDTLQRMRKGSKGKATGKFKFKDGQELPTPNEVIREMMKKARGDYVLESEQTVAQRLLLSDPTDAAKILKAFPGTPNQVLAKKPYTSVTDSLVSQKGHISLAQGLKLLGPIKE
jgi:hypothetical protein